jgi:hypothetical protein
VLLRKFEQTYTFEQIVSSRSIRISSSSVLHVVVRENSTLLRASTMEMLRTSDMVLILVVMVKSQSIRGLKLASLLNYESTLCLSFPALDVFLQRQALWHAIEKKTF